MPGFGSTIRVSRRTGWEQAYLDYASLKLFLTRIEAVYEETGTNRRKQYTSDLFLYDLDNDNLMMDDCCNSSTSLDEDFDDDDNDDGGSSVGTNTDRSLMEDYECNVFEAFTPPKRSYSTIDGITRNSGISSLDYIKKINKKPSYSIKKQLFRHQHDNNNNKTASSNNIKSKMPCYLHKAHKKARGITDSFLRLLQVEVEKVELFAYSRIGELSDAIGSLRIEKNYNTDTAAKEESNNNKYYSYYNITNIDNTNSYNNNYRLHPLSYGVGLHPSESSSSDEDCSHESQESSNLFRSDYNRSSTRDKSPESPKYPNSRNYQQQRQQQHQPSSLFRSTDILGDDNKNNNYKEETIDSYVTIAVEVLHLLRYLCVNVIAIRKICRKHDRLLSNHMLGGYYQLQNNNTNNDTSSCCKHLIKILTKSTNNNKLIGKYDHKIQSILNSPTIKVITSCLSSALSDYELSHYNNQANTILAKLNATNYESAHTLLKSTNTTFAYQSFNQNIIRNAMYNPLQHQQHQQHDNNKSKNDNNSKMDDDDLSNNTTNNNISLIKLKFTTVSIKALQHLTTTKTNTCFKIFTSRSSMTYAGIDTLGQYNLNPESSNRDFLDFISQLNPCLISQNKISIQRMQYCFKKENSNYDIANAVLLSLGDVTKYHGLDLLLDKYKFVVSNDYDDYSTENYDSSRSSRSSNNWNVFSFGELGGTINDNSLLLSLFSLLLYSTNYYIITPSSLSHASYFSTTTTISSSSLIGITNLSSILSAVLQIYYISFLLLDVDDNHKKSHNNHHSKNHHQHHHPVPLNDSTNIKNTLILCSILPLLGNLLYIISLKYAMIKLAFLGRLFIGFGCTDVINRSLIISVVPSYQLIPLSIKYILFTWFGTCLGLFLGGFFHNPKTASALLACLWLFQLFGVIYVFQEPIHPNNNNNNSTNHKKEKKQENQKIASCILPCRSDSSEAEISETFYSDSSNSASPNQSPTKKNVTFDAILSATSNRIRTTDTLDLDYFALLQQQQHQNNNEHNLITCSHSTTTTTTTTTTHLRYFSNRLLRLRKLLFCGNNITFPITCCILVYIKLSQEVLLSSFAIITKRYFNWSDLCTSVVLTTFAFLALPSYFIAGVYTKYYDERRALKVSIIYAGLGFILMINYHTFSPLRKLFFHNSESNDNNSTETTIVPHSSTSASIGRYKYLLACTIIFISCIIMEASTLSLMSKVVPVKKKFSVISCGLLVTILSSIGRYMADCYISFAVVFSIHSIDIDIENLLFVPFILVSTMIYVIIKRNYFFLDYLSK